MRRIPRRLYLAPLLMAALSCLAAGSAHADVFRPAYLELRETGEGRYSVMWKVPAQGDLRLAIHVRFPPDTQTLEAPQAMFVDSAFIERWSIMHPRLAGQEIAIDGIAGGITDVIARIERRDGSSQVERLLPSQPSFIVAAAPSTAQVAGSYLVLGVEHILGGIDHLMFVLALLLIVKGSMRILATITAFTVAHSVTLGAATLGWVHVPGPPVEALIALSIVFVAAEILRGFSGKTGLTAQAPWIVAFSFGLLHGLGFAGALAEVGLPQKAIPVALLMFNVGVELGQLIFVTCVLGGAVLLKRLPVSQRPWARYAMPYLIGGIAMFWVIERVSAFVVE